MISDCRECGESGGWHKRTCSQYVEPTDKPTAPDAVAKNLRRAAEQLAAIFADIRRRSRPSQMSTVHRYRPTFFWGFPEESATYETLDELLAIPWIASWRELPGFHRFSAQEDLLMAEFEEGRVWWVVAMLDEPVPDLPEWEPKR